MRRTKPAAIKPTAKTAPRGSTMEAPSSLEGEVRKGEEWEGETIKEEEREKRGGGV